MREAIKLNVKAQVVCKKLECQDNAVERFQLHDGLLYYKDHVHVLRVPNLREEILAHFHNSKEGGHSKWLKTYVKLKHFSFGKVIGPASSINRTLEWTPP